MCPSLVPCKTQWLLAKASCQQRRTAGTWQSGQEEKYSIWIDVAPFAWHYARINRAQQSLESANQFVGQLICQHMFVAQRHSGVRCKLKSIEFCGHAGKTNHRSAIWPPQRPSHWNLTLEWLLAIDLIHVLKTVPLKHLRGLWIK